MSRDPERLEGVGCFGVAEADVRLLADRLANLALAAEGGKLDALCDGDRFHDFDVETVGPSLAIPAFVPRGAGDTDDSNNLAGAGRVDHEQVTLLDATRTVGKVDPLATVVVVPPVTLIQSISMEGSRPEDIAFIGDALELKVPGPFLRVGGGIAVLDFPVFGISGFDYALRIGNSGDIPVQDVSSGTYKLIMGRGLREYQFSQIVPQPILLDPMRWESKDHLRVTAIGIDLDGSRGSERNNLYAGVLFGFALSLLLPMIALTTRAWRRYAQPTQQRRRRPRRS